MRFFIVFTSGDNEFCLVIINTSGDNGIFLKCVISHNFSKKFKTTLGDIGNCPSKNIVPTI